jgi:hypothetical protein
VFEPVRKWIPSRHVRETSALVTFGPRSQPANNF